MRMEATSAQSWVSPNCPLVFTDEDKHKQEEPACVLQSRPGLAQEAEAAALPCSGQVLSGESMGGQRFFPSTLSPASPGPGSMGMVRRRQPLLLLLSGTQWTFGVNLP